MGAAPQLVSSYSTNQGQSLQGIQGQHSPMSVRTVFDQPGFVNNANGVAGGGAQSWRPIWQAGPNGGRVSSIAAFSGTGSSPTFQLGVGVTVTPVGAVTALTKGAAGTTLDSISRSTAFGNQSFVQDGWLPGDLLLIVGNSTEKNNITQQVGSVAAGTLTLGSGAALSATDNSPATTSLLRLTILTPAISLTTLTSTDIMADLPWLPSQPDRYMILGPNEFLCGFFGVTPTAPNISTSTTYYGVFLQNYVYVTGGWY